MTPRDQGFTLIELMVSLLIFAILSAAAVALLANGVRAQTVMSARLDEGAALRRLDALMEADFAQALPRAPRDESGARGLPFEGSDSAVRLVRGGWDADDDAPRPAEQKVEYRVSGDTLERLSYPQVDGAAPIAVTRLMSGLTHVTLRYRSRGAWSDRWSGAADTPLPDAIEWRFERPGGTALRELFLVGAGAPPAQATPRG